MSTEPATLYDVVHAALFAEHTQLPGEPNPCIVAAGVDYLAARVTDRVEASGVLDGYDQKSRGPEYRRGFADGRLAERAGASR